MPNLPKALDEDELTERLASVFKRCGELESVCLNDTLDQETKDKVRAQIDAVNKTKGAKGARQRAQLMTRSPVSGASSFYLQSST